MKLFAKLFVLVLLSVTLFVPAVLAKGERAPVAVVLGRNEVVNKDYFAAGDTVTVSGTVNGDAYVAGGTVLIDGTINGDLLVTGGMIDIKGPVKEDIRAAGGSLTISSIVGGNVTAGAGTIAIDPTARIAGSIVAGSGTLNVLAPVGKGITAGAGTLMVNSSVGGDILAGVGQLIMQPKTRVAGDVTYWSEKEATIADNVALSGELTYHNLPKTKTKPGLAKVGLLGASGVFTGTALIMAGIAFLTVFVLGLILTALLPRFSEKAVGMMQKNAWGSFGLGIASVIVLPIVAITAFVTVIGIPLGIFLLVALGLLCFVGHIYAAIFIGRGVFVWFKKEVHRTWQLLVGLLILVVFTFVPILGWLARAIFVLIGIGAVLFEKHSVYKHMRLRHLV